MAVAPFVISTSIPGDVDIVSQFPGVDRGLRDVINSWLQVDHNTNPGGHKQITMDQGADPAAVAGKTVISSRADGSIVKQNGTNPVEYVGAFPGAMLATLLSTAQPGWLIADGSAVSRTTYATLFALFGTTYGVGDGSTTFNLPDLRSRTLIQQDTVGKTGSLAGLLTVAGGNTDGSILGGTGGLQNHVQTASEVGTHGHTNTFTNPTYKLGAAGNLEGAATTGLFATGNPANVLAPDTSAISLQAAGSVAIDNGGGGAAFTVMNPYIIVNWMIKF